VLEGRCPAEFSSNPNQTHLNQLIKGHVFVEPQTPLKNASKASEAALLGSHKNMGPLTTPTKGLEAPSSEPWTPTSNLKMLISAASPEIRNREKDRVVDSGESENSQVSVKVCA
uniref:Uncharacterized protein n=1 Tax=Sinocyclocheilus anshuiensis TaxID=1608454 RepID=A0A671LFC0_9TELE